MLKCWRLRGTLAASVYGDVTESERARLDAHLVTCAHCRDQQAAFAALTDAIPVTAAALDRDLVPAIRSAAAPARRPRELRLAWTGLAAAAALIAIVAVPYIRTQYHPVLAPAPAANVGLTPIEQAIGAADQMADQRDFASAYKILKKAVETHPDDSAAAEAQCRRASMAFAELHWYAEALDDYESLAKQYPARFRDDPEAIARRDLLAEARTHDFASLYALDTARRHSTDTFAQLEQVVGRYPGTFVASMAAQDMARLVTNTSPSPDRAKAFMAARDRCTDPTARAQLSMELGHVYLKDLKEPLKASEQYRDAAASPNTVVAKLAAECLSRVSTEQ